MSKIGGRKKKMTAAEEKAGGAKGVASESKAQTWNKQADKSLNAAGFSEQDIEFMKKAIQVLC